MLVTIHNVIFSTSPYVICMNSFVVYKNSFVIYGLFLIVYSLQNVPPPLTMIFLEGLVQYVFLDTYTSQIPFLKNWINDFKNVKKKLFYVLLGIDPSADNLLEMCIFNTTFLIFADFCEVIRRPFYLLLKLFLWNIISLNSKLNIPRWRPRKMSLETYFVLCLSASRCLQQMPHHGYCEGRIYLYTRTYGFHEFCSDQIARAEVFQQKIRDLQHSRIQSNQF